MKKNTTMVLIIFTIALIAASAFAQECTSCGTEENSYVTDTLNPSSVAIKIEKIAPEKIVKGEILEVEIKIRNNINTEIQADIRENFGDAETIDVRPFESKIPSTRVTGTSPYTASIILRPNSLTSIKYKIRPPWFGDFRITPTKIQTPTGYYESDTLEVLVECNKNTECETDLGENAFTCPEDCKPEKMDKICNKAGDGICDPDCKSGEDSDCAVSKTTTTQKTTTTISSGCGNAKCDSLLGENYFTCSKDCSSGGRDGACDKIKDNRCDPDCVSGEDIDCSQAGSGGLLVALIFTLIIVLAVAYKKKWLKLQR